MVTRQEPSPTRSSTLSFGKYRLFARVGAGGAADVFLAVSGSGESAKVIVVNHVRSTSSSDETGRLTFLNDARIATNLRHPNIAQTFEGGTRGDGYYLALEYVDGPSLSRVVSKLKRERKLLDPKIAARICAKALAGLHYAHELADADGKALQIVHRAVSPHNIMLTYDGGVKLVEFGLARALSQSQAAHGVFKSEIAFMAPEQVVGEKVDRRSDVFAVGVCLWEAVTGKRLITQDTPAKTLFNLMNKEMPRASEVNAAVPTALCDVIHKALQRAPENRHQTADEMRVALEAYIVEAGGVDDKDIASLAERVFANTRRKIRTEIDNQFSNRGKRRSAEDEYYAAQTQIRKRGSPFVDFSDSEEGEPRTDLRRLVITAAVPTNTPPKTAPRWLVGLLLAIIAVFATLIVILLSTGHGTSGKPVAPPNAPGAR